MVAFEISINGELRCIAGFPEHHMLSATMMNKSGEDVEAISLNVQGSDLNIFKDLKFSPNQDQKEKLPILLDRINKHGYKTKEWVNEQLPREVEIEIRVVDIEPELLSEGKEHMRDLKDLGGIMTKYFG